MFSIQTDTTNYFYTNSIYGSIAGDSYSILNDLSYATQNNTAITNFNSGKFYVEISDKVIDIWERNSSFLIEGASPSSKYMDATYSL